MDHFEIKSKLYEYLDGELSRAETLYFSQHIDLCPECKLEVQGWEVNRKLLLYESEVRVPAGFADRVMERVVSASETAPMKRTFRIWDYLNLPGWEFAATLTGFLIIAAYFAMDHYSRKTSDNQDLIAAAYSDMSLEGQEVTLYE